MKADSTKETQKRKIRQIRERKNRIRKKKILVKKMN